MLHKLSKINQLASSMAPQGTKHFNATLPVLLHVLAKCANGSYLLRLGNTKIESHAQTPLHIGARYWANIQQNQAGQIIISKLVPKPNIDALLHNTPLKLTPNDLQHLATEPKAFIEELRDFLALQLASATNKEDFSNLSQLALSLAQGVLSLVISDDGKEQLLQIAPKRSALEFYAIFSHLGPLSGSIWLDANVDSSNHHAKNISNNADQYSSAKDLQEHMPKASSKPSSHTKPSQKAVRKEALCAHFCVMNEQVQELLQRYKHELGFDSITISSEGIPQALRTISATSLLDVRT